MDFSYVEEVTDLQSVVKTARSLRAYYNKAIPERKRLMKVARDTEDEELGTLMRQLVPPAWFMVTECEACPQFSLVSAKQSASSRFVCGACREPASVAWVEEGSEDKVLAMYDRWVEKSLKSEEPKATRGAWEVKAREMHAADAKRSGCKVERQGKPCSWCASA